MLTDNSSPVASELLIRLAAEPTIQHLFERILKEARELTNADGGSLYLVKGDPASKDSYLQFAVVQNESLGIHYGGTSGQAIPFPNLPLYKNGKEIHNNVCTHVVHHHTISNIENAYQTEAFDFSGTKSFDRNTNYRSASFLTIPLTNHEFDVIGVLQLVNAIDRETGEVVPFSHDIEPMINAMASYAAIVLNNQLLVEELKNLLDAFIRCIAEAIDAKSPHTSAHCQRIPVLMELIAKAACEDNTTFKDFSLNEDEWYELKVAAWMHDCGKLSTPDHVLDKSTKLHTLRDGIEAVKGRFDLMIRDAEIDCLKRCLAEPEQTCQWEADRDKEINRLREERRFIEKANTGGEFMAEEDMERVRRIAKQSWRDSQGDTHALLSEDEVHNLCISRGTLTAEEREVINNHMVVTINMLESLPFPKKLRRVPEYAGGHHEKMDGTGFPLGLTRDQMSIPARMMAVADIFEALTAKERPYKKPMPISVALSILKRMRDDQHIDPDVYQLIVRSKIWEKYQEHLLPEQLDVEDISSFLE
jgi:HD-GYP domain-containing protein (c-di-GMP phosphodiesterase class II)